jgi:hypothetical protein
LGLGGAEAANTGSQQEVGEFHGEAKKEVGW